MGDLNLEIVSKLGKRSLADELGKAYQECKKAESNLNILKEEFKRRGLTHAEGERFVISKSESTRETLDTRAIRLAMGAIWCMKYTVNSLVERINVTVKEK